MNRTLFFRIATALFLLGFATSSYAQAPGVPTPTPADTILPVGKLHVWRAPPYRLRNVSVTTATRPKVLQRIRRSVC